MYAWGIWMLAHTLTCLFFGIGTVLLVAWAIKYMKKDALKKAGWAFVAAAVAIGIITMVIGGYAMHGKWDRDGKGLNWTCAEDDAECAAKKAELMEKRGKKSAEDTVTESAQ